MIINLIWKFFIQYFNEKIKGERAVKYIIFLPKKISTVAHLNNHYWVGFSISIILLVRENKTIKIFIYLFIYTINYVQLRMRWNHNNGIMWIDCFFSFAFFSKKGLKKKRYKPIFFLFNTKPNSWTMDKRSQYWIQWIGNMSKARTSLVEKKRKNVHVQWIISFVWHYQDH